MKISKQLPVFRSIKITLFISDENSEEFLLAAYDVVFNWPKRIKRVVFACVFSTTFRFLLKTYLTLLSGLKLVRLLGTNCRGMKGTKSMFSDAGNVYVEIIQYLTKITILGLVALAVSFKLLKLSQIGGCDIESAQIILLPSYLCTHLKSVKNLIILI